MKPTGKSIAEFWSKCTVGTRMTFLDNTYREGAAGTSGVISKPGKSTMRLTQDDGSHFWLNPPKNVSDVIELTEKTITYRIGRDEHTATWIRGEE